jgi:hypothetical protein
VTLPPIFDTSKKPKLISCHNSTIHQHTTKMQQTEIVSKLNGHYEPKSLSFKEDVQEILHLEGINTSKVDYDSGRRDRVFYTKTDGEEGILRFWSIIGNKIQFSIYRNDGTNPPCVGNIQGHKAFLEQLFPTLSEIYPEKGIARLIVDYYNPQVLIRPRRYKIIPHHSWTNNTIKWSFSIVVEQLEDDSFCAELQSDEKLSGEIREKFLEQITSRHTCFIKHDLAFQNKMNDLIAAENYTELDRILDLYHTFRCQLNIFRKRLSWQLNEDDDESELDCRLCGNLVDYNGQGDPNTCHPSNILGYCISCYNIHRSLLEAGNGHSSHFYTARCPHSIRPYAAICPQSVDCRNFNIHQEFHGCEACVNDPRNNQGTVCCHYQPIVIKLLDAKVPRTFM